MTQHHEVSIVIPTFNRADLLVETIDSCLAQTMPCEIVVVAHGCTDHTDEVIARYKDKIVYIKREKDFGPHYCWLDGIMHASGKYVHLNYDDDLIKPNFIAETMAQMQDDVGFVFSAACVFDVQKKTEMPMFTNLFSGTGTYPVNQIEGMLMRRLISPGAILFRREDMIDGLYLGKTPLAENHYHGVGPDCFFTLLCLLRYPKFGYVQDTLAWFRAHEGSITIDAHNDKVKKKKIRAAYRDVRRYYKGLKLLQTKQKILKFLTFGLLK